MRIVSYTEARNSLKSVLDTVEGDADITIITRRDGGDAVVMSLAQYESMAETLHLLSSPANAAHLAESIAQYKAGKAQRASWWPREPRRSLYPRCLGGLPILAGTRQKDPQTHQYADRRRPARPISRHWQA